MFKSWIFKILVTITLTSPLTLKAETDENASQIARDTNRLLFHIRSLGIFSQIKESMAETESLTKQTTEYQEKLIFKLITLQEIKESKIELESSSSNPIPPKEDRFKKAKEMAKSLSEQLSKLEDLAPQIDGLWTPHASETVRSSLHPASRDSYKQMEELSKFYQELTTAFNIQFRASELDLNTNLSTNEEIGSQLKKSEDALIIFREFYTYLILLHQRVMHLVLKERIFEVGLRGLVSTPTQGDHLFIDAKNIEVENQEVLLEKTLRRCLELEKNFILYSNILNVMQRNNIKSEATSSEKKVSPWPEVPQIQSLPIELIFLIEILEWAYIKQDKNPKVWEALLAVNKLLDCIEYSILTTKKALESLPKEETDKDKEENWNFASQNFFPLLLAQGDLEKLYENLIHYIIALHGGEKIIITTTHQHGNSVITLKGEGSEFQLARKDFDKQVSAVKESDSLLAIVSEGRSNIHVEIESKVLPNKPEPKLELESNTD